MKNFTNFLLREIGIYTQILNSLKFHSYTSFIFCNYKTVRNVLLQYGAKWTIIKINFFFIPIIQYKLKNIAVQIEVHVHTEVVMFASVLSAAILGMDVHPIQVEADVSDGLPTFTMVGFPSAQVKEAQDRVRTALKNNGIALPPKRITVNFAPADIKKEGAGFDLPLAAAVLAASDILKSEQLDRVMMAGEISLNGEIHAIIRDFAYNHQGEGRKVSGFVLFHMRIVGSDTDTGYEGRLEFAICRK